MKTILNALTLLNVLHYVNGQVCLTSPPELSWDDSTGVNQATLTYDSKRFDSSETGFPIGFTTRVHNGEIPSPTLRFERGQIYHLTLINNLTPDTPSLIYNQIKDLSITNIHTHGLHISGETPSDNVFDTINGGEQMTYQYNIPCDHAGGTFWYHPHHHGSTAVQVGGGSVGALIVDDSSEEEGHPLWLSSMDELVLVIQHLDLRRVRQIGRSNIANGIIDNVFQTDNNGIGTDFWIINGKYQPDICMTTGVWKRFRIINADLTTPNEYEIDAGNVNSPCEVYLIARDGVLIHGENNQVPRQITTRKMYFSVASRADVAVRCSTAGTYTITTDANNGGNRVIANIVVTDSVLGGTDNIPLTIFNPNRPQYLHSLLSVDPTVWVQNGGEYNTETLRVDRLLATDDPERRFAINGQLFGGPDINIFTDTIKAGSLQEWTIQRSNAHPFHIHVNHFQVISGGITGTDTNWTQIGDWLDVLNNQGTVRFVADRFGGKVIMHCHILEHEDRGTMAVAIIEGGCDALGGHLDGTTRPCNETKNCNEPFFDPPTLSPTTTPICKQSGSACSSGSECCSGRCRRNGLCR